MQIQLVTVGTLKEKWLREAFAEYEKRLGRYCKFSVTELNESRLPESPSEAEIAAALLNESRAIMQACKGKIVAMCIEGNQLSSEEFAGYLDRAAVSGDSALSFVIGSSFGLHDSVKNAAAMRFSMSKMTFTHTCRLILFEQIYRAFRIVSGEPYHK